MKKMISQRFLLRTFSGLLAAAAGIIPPTTPISVPAICGAAAITSLICAPEASARPARRVARRTTRRVVRRHLWAMPAAAVPITMGGYRYYRYGGVHYYPYLSGGRTIYVEVDPGYGPPPAADMMYDLGF